MKVEFLISTMNRNDLSFIDKMFSLELIEKINVLIINQCTTIETPKNLEHKYPNIRAISINEKGLSKSRNLALYNAIGDICVIADDDFVYQHDCLKTITQAYSCLPDADIVTFQCTSINTGLLRKKYKKRISKYNLFSIMSVSSADITYKRESIIRESICFDESFGLGTENNAGEDNIFIADAFKRHLKIYSYPGVILGTTDETTGFKMLLQPRKRGRIFKRIYTNPIIFFIVALLSSLRKYNNYKDKYTLYSYMLNILRGGYDE